MQAPRNPRPSRANEVMPSQLTRCAKNLWERLSSAANQFFRPLTEPARPNLVTGTLADLPRRRAELLAENAPADPAGALVADIPRPLGSQLVASRANYPAGHVATLAPRGFSA